MTLRRIGAGLVALVLLTAACARPSSPLPVAPVASPTPAPPIVLPRDAGPHDALTEWWYFTGHLRSDRDGSLYGFEFTVFQAQRQGAPTGYLAHFAISDIGGHFRLLDDTRDFSAPDRHSGPRSCDCDERVTRCGRPGRVVSGH